MNNWKLRAEYQGDNDSDYVEVNGYLASPTSSEPMMRVVPFGNVYAAPLRTAASETHGPVSNQVPGICNGTFTHTGSGAGVNRPATTITGEGSGAAFNYGFLADGTLDYIRASSPGSGYKVGDKLSITTTSGHGSQVIEFRLVDGSNATTVSFRLIHDRQNPTPFPVHRAKCVETSDEFYFHVYDRRSQQVFPRPQDKLLDKYPDAAAAYGLRLLRSAYLGPAIKVRRDSDNATKDIGFSGGNLDTATLLAFAGSQTVTVDTWYDQSGGGNDASQSGTSNQPTIVDAGTLITVNGKPALQFDGSDDGFSIDHADLKNQDRFDAYMHYQTDDTVHIMFVGDGGGKYSFVPQDGGTTETALSSQYDISGTLPTLYVNGVKPGIVSGTTNRDDLHTMMVTNAASHSNGAIMVHEAAGTQGWTDLSISTYSGFHFDGKLTEMVIYNTDQSANREDIEKDMALYSGAYQVEDAPLLDAYGGAHAAYSLRKLNSDYTGPAIRVVKISSSPYPEQDIGFDSNGNLDLDALDTFLDGYAGNVKTWYDQSGNGNDITQSSVGSTPNIQSSAGNLQRVDGRVALRFDGINDALPFDATGLDIGNLSSFAVGKFSNTTGTQYLLAASGNTGGNARWQMPVLYNGDFNYAYGGDVSGVSIDANTNNNLHSMIAGATQTDMEAFLNGTSLGTLSLTTGIDSTTTGIGALGTGGHMNGFIQEVVVYSSDQSERREGIERNISNHYDL